MWLFLFFCLSHTWWMYLFISSALSWSRDQLQQRNLSFFPETPRLWLNKGGVTSGDFCRSFQRLQSKGSLYKPSGLSDCSAVQTETRISSCWNCQICRIRLALPILPHQGSPKTCCSELSSSFVMWGGLLRPPLRHPLAFSRIVVLSSIYSTAF